ncbi:hypothetical protein PACTADRAFT_75729 [Pachysolen tannophilus NRRL Y-2460]|uniref:ASTRA-associated protein 1 n=1 Tax=Pachysolen tannophilus NRRL Y-2460 TaxID=669874 RepID=A0A1E4TU65_PACTA|nr:hypothetical protein PACTADRAFT_75729 [Pachysolen tannophilus NRRL Y-2460]
MLKTSFGDSDSKYERLVPLATLRGHTKSISTFQYIYLPSNLCYIEKSSLTVENKTYVQLLTPTLLTADELGWLIWWDLNTKRPLGVWKGHDATILTIKQLGIDWRLDAVKGYAVPIIKDFKVFGKVLTHGKDSEIKIWNLFEMLDNDFSSFKFQIVHSKKLPIENCDNIEKLWPSSCYYKIPVNTLNYSNVDIIGRQLITPSTINSNNFDIFLLQLNAEDKLSRIFKDISITEKIETNFDSNIMKNRDFGIIMKFKWINEFEVAIGYESGHVAIFNLDFVKKQVNILKLDSTHSPHPILALDYDILHNRIISSSAGGKLSFISLNDKDLITTENIKHNGISSISSRSDGLLAVTTWNGYTRVYNTNTNNNTNNNTMTLKFKINRFTPSVAVNAINLENKEGIDSKIKSVIVLFAEIQQNYTQANTDKSLSYNNGTSKLIVRNRDKTSFDRRYMCVGFNDGRVVVYDI